jgi:hypothetical protein
MPIHLEEILMKHVVIAAVLAVIGLSSAATVEARETGAQMVAARQAGGGFFSRMMELERRKNERIRQFFRGGR